MLPPVIGIKITWARTGGFSEDVISQKNAQLAEEDLLRIRDAADKSEDEDEKRYIFAAIASMDASLRNLDIITKGRDTNFEQNEKLRSAYLRTIEENIEFGNRAKDILKSLPTMSVASLGGVTVFDVIADYIGRALTTASMVLILLGSAGAGYLINLYFVRESRKRQQELLIKEDYERQLYFDQYVNRVKLTLMALYNDLNRLHENFIGTAYPEKSDVEKAVLELLEGARPTFCEYVHKHMREGKITPELWVKCETGANENCPQYEGYNRKVFGKSSRLKDGG